jgi:hypothetical protein
MDTKTMNTLELSQAIGQTGMLFVAAKGYSNTPLYVSVQVLKARQACGRIDYLVAPISGSGEMWVSSERVKLSASESNSKEE